MTSMIVRSPLYKPGLISVPFASEPAAGHEFVNLKSLGFYQAMRGAEGGYHTEADALVNVTADGVDINSLWAEFQQTLDIFNERRQTLINLMTYAVTDLIERVPTVTGTEFEEASEFGVPRGNRVEQSYLEMAYDFRDYDSATRFTWKYLRDADARAVEAVHRAILEADNKLLFRKIMEAIFDNGGRKSNINKQNYNVYPLYNGDGMIPPKWKETPFDGTHTHYLVGGAALTNGVSLIDSGDLDDAYEHIAHHGYGFEQGTTFVVMLNSREMKEVRKFRAGVVNNNGVTANYDFIPAVNQPAMIVPNSDGLIGVQPPASYLGLSVTGTYRGMWLIEEDYIPAGYMLTFGSGGTGNLQNLVGFREHQNPQYRGLRLLPGNQQRYPLVDSYYSRGFGTGIRQRGAAVVTQFKPSGSYAPPAQFTRGGGLS